MVKFDSRDKKPNLLSIAVISVIAVVLMIFLLKNPGDIKLAEACIVVDIYLILVIILLVSAFFKQLQYNPYSYNIIYYSGFSIFLLSVLISHITVTVSVFSIPDLHGIWSITSVLAGSARNYMLFSAPFVLVFSVALFISNISLIRHEGKRFVNYLGMLLAILMVAGELFLFLVDYYSAGSWAEVFIHDLFVNIFAAFYLYFECMVIGAIIANSIAAKHEPEKDKDFIIILGCSLRKDGTPTPLLAGRIDRALGFYRTQIEQTGKVPVIIPSGGQGSDEMHSESAAMTEYLLARNVPREHIMMEDQSRNTFENMLFSKAMIMERCHDAEEIFSKEKVDFFGILKDDY